MGCCCHTNSGFAFDDPVPLNIKFCRFPFTKRWTTLLQNKLDLEENFGRVQIINEGENH